MNDNSKEFPPIIMKPTITNDTWVDLLHQQQAKEKNQ